MGEYAHPLSSSQLHGMCACVFVCICVCMCMFGCVLVVFVCGYGVSVYVCCCVCVYACMYIYIWCAVCLCMCLCVWCTLCKCACVCINIWYVWLSVSVYVCIWYIVYMCVNVHVYGVCLYDLSMHVSVCVFVSVCIYGLYMCVLGDLCVCVCVCVCVWKARKGERHLLCHRGQQTIAHKPSTACCWFLYGLQTKNHFYICKWLTKKSKEELYFMMWKLYDVQISVSHKSSVWEGDQCSFTHSLWLLSCDSGRVGWLWQQLCGLWSLKMDYLALCRTCVPAPGLPYMGTFSWFISFIPPLILWCFFVSNVPMLEVRAGAWSHVAFDLSLSDSTVGTLSTLPAGWHLPLNLHHS